MSYYAFDANGYVGDVASINGWNEFAAWAIAQGGELEKFAREGQSQNLKALAAQLERSKATGDVESTRTGIAALIDKASEILIVNEGDET